MILEKGMPGPGRTPLIGRDERSYGAADERQRNVERSVAHDFTRYGCVRQIRPSFFNSSGGGPSKRASGTLPT